MSLIDTDLPVSTNANYCITISLADTVTNDKYSHPLQPLKICLYQLNSKSTSYEILCIESVMSFKGVCVYRRVYTFIAQIVYIDI